MSRYDTIPKAWWQWMGTGFKLLDQDLAAIETGGVSASPVAGVPITVEPNQEGTWDGVVTDRLDGYRYWWLRALSSTDNAPIPSFSQGYEMGDFVSPPPDASKGEALPFLGIVWSDSMATSGSGSLAGRVTNNYAGGVGPHQWGSTQGAGTAFPRVRQMSDIGLECADTGVAFIQSPPVNITGDHSVTWNTNARTTSFAGGLVLTGTSNSTRVTCLWVRGTTENASTAQVEVSIRHMEPEAWAAPTMLGTVTTPQWTPIKITRRGAVVTVEFAGQTWTHTLIGEAATNPRQLAFIAGPWGTFSAKNIIFEAL